MPDASILSVLRERAGLTPDDVAYTFTDYDHDWDGVTESLTWAQLYRRTLNVAHELRMHGVPGDRALIIAPQGLAYIVGFLGAMQAGFIAVPLSVPLRPRRWCAAAPPSPTIMRSAPTTSRG